MSLSFSGTVQAIRQDRKAVKIGNEWYSVRDSSAFGAAEKGNTVGGTYTKNGNWNNCDESSIKVTAGASGAANGTSPAPGGSKKGGDSGFRSPEEIIRTTAIEQSVEFFATTSGLDGDTYPEQVEKLLRTADLFTAYIQGNIVLPTSQQAAAPAPEAAPVVAPEPEPAPEQEEAVPAALSSFLGG